MRNRFSRRRFIHNFMENWGGSGNAGTPPGLFRWVSKPQNKRFLPYMSRLDHKYSHRSMRLRGLLS